MSHRNMTERIIKRDQDICDGATKGPWHWGMFEMSIEQAKKVVLLDALYRISPQMVNKAGGLNPQDAVFCAKARQGWPRALAEVRRLRNRLAEYEEVDPTGEKLLRRVEYDE